MLDVASQLTNMPTLLCPARYEKAFPRARLQCSVARVIHTPLGETLAVPVQRCICMGAASGMARGFSCPRFPRNGFNLPNRTW